MSVNEVEYSDWFEREVKPHETALKGFLYNVVPENVDVDDVLQETYKRILSVKRGKPIQSARGLLFAIAKNVTRDLFRKKSGSNIINVADLHEFDVVDGEVGPFEAVCRQDEIRLLGEAIETLPPRCRRILILRKYEQMTTSQIAIEMNISVNTVETQLARGLLKCKRYFKGKGLK